MEVPQLPLLPFDQPAAALPRFGMENDQIVTLMLPEMVDPRGMNIVSQEIKPVVRRSRFRGLTWDKKERRWRVRINVMGKQHHVGRYYSEVEAARAFDRAALCIYGDLAITNFGLMAARQDPTPVSAHILMVKQEYDRFRRQQQAEQLANGTGDVGLASMSLPGGVSSNPLQQLLHCQQQLLNGRNGHVTSLSTPSNGVSHTLPLMPAQAAMASSKSLSEPLPELNQYRPVAVSGGLTYVNSPASYNSLMGQLNGLNLGQQQPFVSGPQSLAPSSMGYGSSHSHGAFLNQLDAPTSAPGFTPMPSSMDHPSELSRQQSAPAEVTGQTASLLVWAQQQGLLSPNTPLGDVMGLLHSNAGSASTSSSCSALPPVSSGLMMVGDWVDATNAIGASGPGEEEPPGLDNGVAKAPPRKCSSDGVAISRQQLAEGPWLSRHGSGPEPGAARTGSGPLAALDLDVMASLQQEAQLEALIKEQQQQLAHLQQLRVQQQQQRATLLQQQQLA